MSTGKTMIGITCRQGDVMSVLNINIQLKLGLAKRSVNDNNFVLFATEVDNLSREDIFKIILLFTESSWVHPDYCTMILESDEHSDLDGVTVPNNSTC